MSTTPSPTKRTPLSSKTFNISPTPLKRPNPVHLPSRLSPTKRLAPARNTPSPPKKSTGLNFTIWEDKTEKPEFPEQEYPCSNKQNNHDQENILQPKKNDIIRSSVRSPLADLSINEYPGFVSYGGPEFKLGELYQPPNFNNEFKSLHKHSSLPNYLTPSRKHSGRDKYLVVSGTTPDIDETELLLIEKQQRLSNKVIRKHTRSLSVGKNEAKLSLIRKNNFSILSN
ncbi:uncharacterized protein SPAPADRAFT_63282 [Spathaspora passalidarum NRRL Y-27907]|uniref:Uncharacterized protein n=1 Tax=Spathaspora passalidarum (strain NRRL Y-27907 / 11-Y1) TaxID=619300 RepID=G3AU71_SPAPN|nr:uncharacterized protein SPAPADRAFT_63282 [Spathaspora passalidarum NRRL Y-27907]EGW30447.1 hypothetical protein SPAPADRAFT_63282 [Spathaspora passalidarum NRRL Y-27907]